MESVFRGKDSYIDFSYDLRDKRDWKTATIREVEYLSDVSAFAVEATNGLIAIGQSIHDPQKEDANLRTNKTYLWSPLTAKAPNMERFLFSAQPQLAQFSGYREELQ